MIAENLKKYFNMLTDEFEARLDQLSQLVDHRPAIGTYRETILRGFISETVGRRYGVGSGFLLTDNANSRQIDILIYDRHSDAVYFDRAGIVVVSPEQVLAMIEVKSVAALGSLSKERLLDGLTQLVEPKLAAPAGRTALFVFGTMGEAVLKEAIEQATATLPPEAFPDAIVFLRGPVILKVPKDGFLCVEVYKLLKPDSALGCFFGFLHSRLYSRQTHLPSAGVDGIFQWRAHFSPPPTE